MYNDLISLINKTKTVNDVGDIVETTSLRDVFAKVKSIGQNEFYMAQSSGLKPELKFVIADYLDYQNEPELMFNNRKYQVLRTFRKEISLEITAAGGVNVGST